MKSLKLRVVAFIAALALITVPMFAQAISGDLVGTVTDASGAAVPNADVTATNTGTGIKSSTVANANGEYRIPNLEPGTYNLTAAASGFATAELRDLAVKLNQATTANLSLKIGTVSTSIEVTEAGAAIDTTTAQIQNTFSTKQIADLPNTGIGNGVLNLSLLNAGVTSSGGVGVGTGPSIGGQRPRNNNFTIDGIDNNAKSVTGPVVFIPNESVGEFTLLQNQFEAEYGHSSGGQFNTVVKSGTNTFHGTIYDYLRNRNLNAVDQSFKNKGFFSLPRYDQNHLGANFGGPIKKEKLFFFTSFEYNPLGQASTPGATVYAPTTAGYTTLAGAPGINQTNLKVLQQYAAAPSVSPGAPSITIGSVSVPTGIIPIAAPNYSNSFFGVFSMDYNLSDKDQLRGRYIYNRSDTINTARKPAGFFHHSSVEIRPRYARRVPHVQSPRYERIPLGLPASKLKQSCRRSNFSGAGCVPESAVHRFASAGRPQSELPAGHHRESVPGNR